MNEEELQRLSDEIVLAISNGFEQYGAAKRQHEEEHSWVREQMKLQAAKAQFYRDLAQKSLPMIAVALIGALGKGIWQLIQLWSNR